jgi:CubicO group peptidase (beta-lactamase class C family)
MSTSSIESVTEIARRKLPGLDDATLRAVITEALDRWPSAGLAVAVTGDGGPARFHGHGIANVDSKAPISPETVFRIGSITKTFTAIAVMQLSEQGLVDLDAPANDYLRAFRLVPATPGLRPATLRHLLTHTAGIGYWRRFSDLLRPGLGSGVQAGRAGAAPMAEYYRRGLPVEVQPGTKWVYSNHGFAALGQIVEDVTGQPLDAYLREHVFRPLGMAHTDLRLSWRICHHLATGYVLRSNGLRAVKDQEVPAVGAGAAYTTTADMGCYVDALLHEGANAHGAVLKPESMATMFRPHFQPDPRVPGMGLGFHLGSEGGHRTVGHDGIVAGFLSQMTFAPDDGVGVVVLANTGGLDGRGAPDSLGTALLRHLLDLPANAIRSDIPPHPEVWQQLCGRYSLEPGPVTNLFTRLFMGAGAEVTVRGGHLMLRPMTPVPALRRGMRLHPDDDSDPYVFRVDFSGLGKGTAPVVFAGFAGSPAAGMLLMDEMAFWKRH